VQKMLTPPVPLLDGAGSTFALKVGAAGQARSQSAGVRGAGGPPRSPPRSQSAGLRRGGNVLGVLGREAEGLLRDKDVGEHSAADIVAKLGAQLRARHMRHVDLFHALDADQDGQISQPEFAQALSLLGLRAPEGDAALASSPYVSSIFADFHVHERSASAGPAPAPALAKEAPPLDYSALRRRLRHSTPQTGSATPAAGSLHELGGERRQDLIAGSADAAVQRLLFRLNERMAYLQPDPNSRSWFLLFKHIDDNESGLISFDELVDMIRNELKMGPYEFPDEDIQTVWHVLDENGDGHITAGEFGASRMTKPAALHGSAMLTPVLRCAGHFMRFRGGTPIMGRPRSGGLARTGGRPDSGSSRADLRVGIDAGRLSPPLAATADFYASLNPLPPWRKRPFTLSGYRAPQRTLIAGDNVRSAAPPPPLSPHAHATPALISPTPKSRDVGRQLRLCSSAPRLGTMRPLRLEEGLPAARVRERRPGSALLRKQQDLQWFEQAVLLP
jgi:Ca2+-binding EF-hand superfamily protein